MSNLPLAILIATVVLFLLAMIFLSSAEAKAHTRLADEIRSWRVARNAPVLIRFDNPLDVVQWDPEPVPQKPPITPADGTPIGDKNGKGVAAVIRTMPRDI